MPRSKKGVAAPCTIQYEPVIRVFDDQLDLVRPEYPTDNGCEAVLGLRIKAATDPRPIDAKLPRAVTSVIRQHALDSYGILGCSGLARVDFLLSDEGVPYVNEVNTLPGFTDISMYPKLWAEKGLGYDKLIDRLIELALE